MAPQCRLIPLMTSTADVISSSREMVMPMNYFTADWISSANRLFFQMLSGLARHWHFVTAYHWFSGR